ncbi:MAG: hypothetical protein JKX83_02070 [Pseudomonadales bacterium]|nr:hypothetical protein [Pseudomonadales bacterium]
MTHSIALLSVASLSIELFLRLFVGSLVLLSWVHTLRLHYFFTSRYAVTAVVLKADKSRVKPLDEAMDAAPEYEWLLELSGDAPDGSGLVSQRSALLHGSYLLTPWLVLLSFKIKGRKRSLPVVLFSDCVAPEPLRRLRALLLH